MAERICSVEGCDRPRRARGWCYLHWERWKRRGDPGCAEPLRMRNPEVCIEADCDAKPVARGWCKDHYQRWSRHGDPNKQVYRPRGSPVPICSVDGCDRAVTGGSASLCKRHYERQRKTGDVGPPGLKIAPKGSGNWYMQQGYLRRSEYADGKLIRTIQQHAYVMEQILGRPLRPGENVHHKNGIRHDNRPENLELWVTTQPKGQRPEDLAAFIIDCYPAELEKLGWRKG